MTLLLKLFSLPLHHRRDLVEAALCLCAARLLLFVPFGWLKPLIGRPRPGVDRSIDTLGTDERTAASAVRCAILRVAERMPWRSTCLVRALAARMMLGRRDLPSVLQLGVRGGSATGLSAHAWLRCGDIDVTGAEIAVEFTPIAAFRK